MTSSNKKTLLIILTLVILALLGVSLGISIMCFIMSLTSSDKLLVIVSYFTLLTFILLLVGLVIIYITYRENKNKKSLKGEDEDERI